MRPLRAVVRDTHCNWIVKEGWCEKTVRGVGRGEVESKEGGRIDVHDA